MKINVKCLVFALILLFQQSCQDTYEISNEELATVSALSAPIYSFEPYKKSVSNPKLYTDWENCSKLILNNGEEKWAPWIYSVDAHSNGIPQEVGVDIKKEHGWDLICHSLINTNYAENNFIIFYNRLRGTLKVYSFEDNPDKSTSAVWVIRPDDPRNRHIPSKSFFENPLNSVTYTKESVTSNLVNNWVPEQNEHPPLHNFWNAFEFELNYAGENIANNKFSIGGYLLNKSSAELNGEYIGNVQIPKDAEKKKGIFSKLEKKLKLTSKAMKFLGVQGTVASTLAKVMGGASSFTDKTGKQTYINATSKGKIDIDGKIIEKINSNLAIYNLDLKDLINYKNKTNEELGLWAINRTSDARFNRYVKMWQEVADAPYRHPSSTINFNILDIRGGDASKIKENIKNTIVINPAILRDIKIYSVDIEFLMGLPLNEHPNWNSTKVLRLNTEGLSKEIWTFDTQIDVNWNSYELLTTSSYYPDAPNNPMRSYVLDRTLTFLPHWKNEKEKKTTFIANITITFTSKDGSKYTSSKNYPIIFSVNSNDSWDVADSYLERSLSRRDRRNDLRSYIRWDHW